jgi:hypothetical protein
MQDLHILTGIFRKQKNWRAEFDPDLSKKAADSSGRTPAMGCSGRVWAEAQQRRQI